MSNARELFVKNVVLMVVLGAVFLVAVWIATMIEPPGLEEKYHDQYLNATEKTLTQLSQNTTITERMKIIEFNCKAYIVQSDYWIQRCMRELDSEMP